MTDKKTIFLTHGVDDPDAWDCELAEYMCCVAAYDEEEVSAYEDCGDGYYDVSFPDGHEIPGVAGFHLSPEPGMSRGDGNTDIDMKVCEEYYRNF